MKISQPSGELANHFYIDQAGHGVEAFLGLQLEDLRIQKALMGLSSAVTSLAFYKRGVELRLTRKQLTPRTLDSDINCACEIAGVLRGWHSIEMIRSAHANRIL